MIAREAWRNVLCGTSRTGIVAAVLVVVAVGFQLADLLTVRGITDRVDAFRAAGADVLVYSSVGGIDPRRCELLAAQPTVIAAGAVRRDPDRFAAVLPASSIPTYAVTPGFPGVLLGTAGDPGPGVVVSRDLADALGLTSADTLQLVDATAPVAAVYDYPQDGRATGFGYAMLAPTRDLAPFDACWVREWPLTESTAMLLRGVGTTSAGTADAPSPELTQLNTSQGRHLDAEGLFATRATRWAPLLALVVAAGVGFASTRLRRLEIASGRHLGVSMSAQVLGSLLESAAWAAPVALAAALSAAAVAAGGHAGDVVATLGLGALAPLATIVGGVVGGAVATATVRERQLLRYLKER